jgi:UDP-glucuronate 4-epimerase
MKILITGAAGFIGGKIACELARRGDEIVGLDNMNDYYDVRLKQKRLSLLSTFPNFRFVKMDITDRKSLVHLFNAEKFDKVIHLAAQVGIRMSSKNPPSLYIDSNLTGFANVLECCRLSEVKLLVFASSSSVYGQRNDTPFSENDVLSTPESMYAATKQANEILAQTYAKNHRMNIVGLRFFTAYGEFGRPDMAPMLFADAIMHNRPLKVFNNGCHYRDFTHIDDIVGGTISVLDVFPKENSADGSYEIYNIGSGKPVLLTDFIAELELALGRTATMEFLPHQKGDVFQTFADMTKLEMEIGFKPKINLREGIRKFAEWYVTDKVSKLWVSCNDAVHFCAGRVDGRIID